MPAHKNFTVCKCCGAVMELTNLDSEEQENWLPCIEPEGFEWNLPSGKITPVAGAPIYVDAFGNKLSHDEYLKKYLVDPEIAYTNMRGKIRKQTVGIGLCNKDEEDQNNPGPKPIKLGKY